VLREFGIVGPAAPFPVVGTLKKIPFSVVELEDFFDPCNVVVTTMAIAGRASSVIQEAFARLAIPFIDEAHHIKAPTWDRCKAHFLHKPCCS